MPAGRGAIFYQTDIKKDGTWVDKGYLVAARRRRSGLRPLWHKSCAARRPGTVTFGRPAYSHMLCFSRGVRADLAKSTAGRAARGGRGDVDARHGRAGVPRRVPVRAGAHAHAHGGGPVLRPGTVLAVANALGLDAMGVELSRKRAKKARNLRMPLGDAEPPGEPAETEPSDE